MFTYKHQKYFITIFLITLILLVSQTVFDASAQDSGSKIPQWVKGNAGLWAGGQISDSDFIQGIQYLVQVGILQASPVEQVNTQTSNVMPTTCTALDGGILPDPVCTPGAVDPRVTQNNIDSTICVSGYTKTVRPPVSVTGPQKLASHTKYPYPLVV